MTCTTISPNIKYFDRYNCEDRTIFYWRLRQHVFPGASVDRSKVFVGLRSRLSTAFTNDSCMLGASK